MKTKVLILVLTVLALGACARKSSKSGASRGARITNGSVVTNTGAGSTTCAANIYGAVYDNGISGYDFTQRLINFTGNSDIGYVESQYNNRISTGVDIRMTAQFNNGQFVAAGSEVLIRIYDDKYAQGLGRLEDIRFVGESGVSRGNGTFTAVFKDQYGTITVEGTRDPSVNMIGGVINFQVSNGGSQPLGRFWISGCSLVGI